jgi:hypothetical protein
MIGGMRILLVAAILATATAAAAQDFVGARALSLGEAYRASATGNDAIYFNPAGLIVIPRYSPEIHYQLDLVDNQHQIDGSVVDSKTSKVAAGLAYTFDGRLNTRRFSQQHTATLALAYPVLDELLSVGAGLKYVNVSDAVLGNYLNALTADIGVLSRISRFGVSLAGVGYNLIRLKESARVPLSAGFAANLDLGPLSALLFGGSPSFGGPAPSAAGAPRITTMGQLSGPLSGLSLEVDWFMKFTALYGMESRVSTGLEYLILDSVPIRLGYMWDERDDEAALADDHLVSAGIGFIVPFFGLDIAYQQSVIRADKRVLSTSLKFFLTL